MTSVATPSAHFAPLRLYRCVYLCTCVCVCQLRILAKRTRMTSTRARRNRLVATLQLLLLLHTRRRQYPNDVIYFPPARCLKPFPYRQTRLDSTGWDVSWPSSDVPSRVFFGVWGLGHSHATDIIVAAPVTTSHDNGRECVSWLVTANHNENLLVRSRSAKLSRVTIWRLV